ncbi:MAG TPA: alpha/beta hydrolase, partial [Gammaproteobacteria bacterium]|nr:alpha/beta hydrolase [Gammaproteobacteria bacterium]
IAIGRQIMAANPLYEDLVACANYTRGSEVAQSLDLPAQLILARKDRLTPVKAGMAFAEELGAQVTIIERYGHMLPIEAPRQTLQKLRELIGSMEVGEREAG